MHPLPPTPTYLLGTLLSGRQGAHQTGGLVAERHRHTHRRGWRRVRQECECRFGGSKQGRPKQATRVQHVRVCMLPMPTADASLLHTAHPPTHSLTHQGTVIQRWGRERQGNTARTDRGASGHMQGQQKHVNARGVMHCVAADTPRLRMHVAGCARRATFAAGLVKLVDPSNLGGQTVMLCWPASLTLLRSGPYQGDSLLSAPPEGPHHPARSLRKQQDHGVKPLHYCIWLWRELHANGRSRGRYSLECVPDLRGECAVLQGAPTAVSCGLRRVRPCQLIRPSW